MEKVNLLLVALLNNIFHLISLLGHVGAAETSCKHNTVISSLFKGPTLRSFLRFTLFFLH